MSASVVPVREDETSAEDMDDGFKAPWKLSARPSEGKESN